MTNDKLPEDIQKQIIADAKRIKRTLIRKTDGDVIYIEGYGEGYVGGATAWAPWKVKHEELLAQTNLSLAIQRQCTTDAQNRCERMIRQRNDMQSMAQRMADALEEIAEGSHDYESTNYAKRLHMPNCRACKAKEALQQFKDGGKEVENG